MVKAKIRVRRGMSLKERVGDEQERWLWFVGGDY